MDAVLQELISLRPAFAQAAQKVYDEWEEGEGGICTLIAKAIKEQISNRGWFLLVEHDDVHDFLTVQGCYRVDIHFHIYEWNPTLDEEDFDLTCWRKRSGVVFKAEDVEIIDRRIKR